ncbi:hypothetical protein E0Z10_g1847 [Xylaria hypoxylon]|uniref:Mid2 domain-containing protein n=1 Tax=Xylaria hypoxylon TaxID=37992 RepID=A0A4Z0YRH8_9PEZI|nr:hypothetical protein E0Z10_g1847 [Xylaria hypoxylon]
MLASLILLALAIRRSDAVCYDTSGLARDGFFPCNTSAEVSVCCGGTDYCLDNGLCLDTTGDNIFTVQACTSVTWDAPCKQYCPGLPPTMNFYQDLTLCKSTDKVSGSVFKAPGVAGDTPAPNSTASPLNSTASPLSQPNESSNQALKLGLGVGLGLGLGLLALALAFYAWELRKKNRYLKIAGSTAPAIWPPNHKDLPWAQDSWRPPEELHDTARTELHDTSVKELPGHGGFI